MDRASTFSDAQIIRKLQTDFVAFAGESHEVWKRPSALKDWFWPMASSVNPRLERGETPQGLYIAGADGTAYDWYHKAREPKPVLEFLDACLDRFRRTPPEKVAIPEDLVRTKLMAPPDPSTSVIRVFCRIRSLPPDAGLIAKSVGRDHLWVYAGEVKELLAAANNTNESLAMPPALVARLARFHLIDFARGQPGKWAGEEVRQATLTARKVRSTDQICGLSFSGNLASQSADGKHGFEGKVEGELDIDRRTTKIVRFRGFGEGHGWGDHSWARGTSDAPEVPEGRFPLVFAFVEAEDALAKTVPPTALYYGAPYAEPKIAARKR